MPREAAIGCEMACLSPIDVRRPDWAVVRRFISVPCGRCVGCRLERARNWTIRIMHEAQMHKENSFLTLTYDDEHLSYGYRQATLCKRDLQLFWKKLRKEINVPIRYFACGEYGEQRRRPHYHACLFGYDFKDKALLSTKDGNDLYSSATLDSVWSNGHCSVGALTPGSAAYVARYILDKKLGKERVYYEKQGIEPEFIVMSRGGREGAGGIGKRWFDKYAGDVYPADRVVIQDGGTSKPPRYYDELRKASHPEEIEGIKQERMRRAEEKPLEERLATRMMSKIRYHESRVKSMDKDLH